MGSIETISRLKQRGANEKQKAPGIGEHFASFALELVLGGNPNEDAKYFSGELRRLVLGDNKTSQTR